jgi:DNA-binding MarR family transcriptional regulator
MEGGYLMDKKQPEFIPEEREDIAVALDRVMRLMRRGRKRTGKGRAAGRVLRTLAAEGPMVTRELAEKLDVRLSSLNETLLKLEEDGLILRSRSEMDGRVHMVQLSTEGMRLAEQIRRDRHAREKQMASCLTEDERKEFVRLMQKLADGLETIRKVEEMEDINNWKKEKSAEWTQMDQDIRLTVMERVFESEIRSRKNAELERYQDSGQGNEDSGQRGE